MTLFIERLLGFGLLILQGVVGIGLLVAAGEVALGRRGGYRRLAGVGVAAIILWLWEAGRLAGVVTDLITELMTGHPAASPLGH